MKTLYLYGDLAEQFGTEIRLAVNSVAEAIRLMEANYPGRFVAAMKDRWFRVGRHNNQACMCEVELLMECGHDEIHIEPEIKGGFKAIFGLFFGAPLLGSIFTPLGLPLFGGAGAGAAGALGFGGAVGGFGSIALGLTLLGVLVLISGALAPDDQQEKEDSDERTSFLFNGAVNQSEQGGSVPLIYGEVITGSTVISGGIAIEDQSL